MTYSEKLKDPRWQKKRLEILSRDNWACVECGAKDKTLHVHHRHYYPTKPAPWDYADCDLESLCWDCHEQKEALFADARFALAIYRIDDLREIVRKLLEISAVDGPGWGAGLVKAMDEYHTKGPQE